MAGVYRHLAAALRRMVPRTTRSISTLSLEAHEAFVHPSEIQRNILVWSRIFKTLQDVPAAVNQMEMSKAYYVFRTEMCFAMYIAGMASAIYKCRQDRKYHIQQSDPQTYVEPSTGLLPAFDLNEMASPF